MKNGIYYGRPTKADPAIYHAVDFASSEYQILIAGMIYNEKTADQIPTLYFQTSKDSTWNAAKSIKGISRIPEGIQDGETYQIIFDLTSCATWKDTITNLRFDPFNMTEDFGIDYIHLYQTASTAN